MMKVIISHCVYHVTILRPLMMAVGVRGGYKSLAPFTLDRLKR